MAGSPPGESNGGARGSFLPVAEPFKPLSGRAISLVRNYDIKGVMAVLAEVSDCPLAVQMEVFRKNLEQFKLPHAIDAFPNDEVDDNDEDEEEGDKNEDDGDAQDEDNDTDEDEDDDVVEDEDGDVVEDEEILKLMVNDNKPATDGQLQVPDEGEPECKKPRLA